MSVNHIHTTVPVTLKLIDVPLKVKIKLQDNCKTWTENETHYCHTIKMTNIKWKEMEGNFHPLLPDM